MKFLLFFILAGLVVAQDKYEPLEESINLSEVLGNERLITSYSKCLLGKGPCTPEVKRLKDTLPEVLETGCAKCSERQKEMGKKVIKEVREKHPDIWHELAVKYDPEGKYRDVFQDYLKP